MVATLVGTTFAQPDAESMWAQHARGVEQLTKSCSVILDHCLAERGVQSRLKDIFADQREDHETGDAGAVAAGTTRAG